MFRCCYNARCISGLHRSQLDGIFREQMLLNRGKGRKWKKKKNKTVMQRNRWLLNCAWGVCISHRTKSKQSPSRCCCLPKPGLLEPGQMCANRPDAETGTTLLSHVFLAGLMFSLTSSLDPDKTSLLWTLRTGAQVQNCAERWEEAFALEPATGDWCWLVLKSWPGPMLWWSTGWFRERPETQ